MKIDHKILGYRQNIEELRGRKDPGALKAVAREMEALFAHEMIKAMRQTVKVTPESGLGGDMYMGLFDLELARLMAERGLGVQEMLLKDLERNTAGPREKAQPTEPAAEGKRPSDPPPTETARPAREKTANQASQGVQSDADGPSLPVSGNITSGFGLRRHPVHGDVRFHHGVDIAAAAGTTIYPAKSGTVVFSGEQPGYGNIVVVSHRDGLITKYAHNSVNLVKAGDEVTAGTPIGKVGSTGVSTGPHLHFEVLRRGQSVNPVTLMARQEAKESLKIDDKKENVT